MMNTQEGYELMVKLRRELRDELLRPFERVEEHVSDEDLERLYPNLTPRLRRHRLREHLVTVLSDMTRRLAWKPTMTSRTWSELPRLLKIMPPEALRVYRWILERVGADADRIAEVQHLIEYKRGLWWLETPFIPGEFEDD